MLSLESGQDLLAKIKVADALDFLEQGLLNWHVISFFLFFDYQFSIYFFALVANFLRFLPWTLAFIGAQELLQVELLVVVLAHTWLRAVF